MKKAILDGIKPDNEFYGVTDLHINSGTQFISNIYSDIDKADEIRDYIASWDHLKNVNFTPRVIIITRESMENALKG